MRLLVLDDDRILAEFFAEEAGRRGWAVEISTNALQFRALLARFQPDAILLDLHLGSSDGVTQLRYLRECNYAGMIILTSGFDKRVLESTMSLGKSLGLHITDILEKPARLARVREVLGTVERLLALMGTRRHADADEVLAQRAIGQADLAAGMEHGELRVFLQPVVSSDFSSLAQFEALVRWQSPAHGLLAPDEFIPLAETEKVLIDKLLECVVTIVLGQCHELRAMGVEYPIAINISGHNLRNLDFPDRLEKLVKSAGVLPNALMLEITETVAMHDPGAIGEILARLRLKGFELAIDDFGIGYSSLKALRRMPFTEIKIDRTFVADLEYSRDSRAIVQSIIALARNMGLTSVAEGVESEAVADILVKMGVDQLQGFHFARPMVFDQLVHWLAGREKVTA